MNYYRYFTGRDFYFDLALDEELTFALLPGIMVTWSPADIDVGIKAALIQSYSILLSTFLSIGRDQLSTTDAAWALTLTSPPLMVYLTIAFICDILGARTNLYKRVRSRRRAVRVLGALVLPLWLALSLTTYFSSEAFSDSKENRGGSFKEWLTTLITDQLPVGNPGGWMYIGIMTPIFLLCLFRRRSQVMEDFRARRKKPSKLRWLRAPWTFVACAWYIPVLSARLTGPNAN